MALEGQVALVTGANKGIGKAIALALGEQGADVAVHFHSDDKNARAVAAEVESTGSRAAIFKADVSQADQVHEMVGRCEDEMGAIDILVNNARHLSEKRKFLELTWADYELQLDVILKGAFNCAQAVLPNMIKKNRGRIINTLSTILEEPNWRWHAYGAAKGAMVQFSKHLAAEMGPHGVTVNMVSPGFTPTERNTQHLDEYLKDYVEHTPMGRFPTPREAADAVAFLASERASFITGANIPVSGGKVMF